MHSVAMRHIKLALTATIIMAYPISALPDESYSWLQGVVSKSPPQKTGLESARYSNMESGRTYDRDSIESTECFNIKLKNTIVLIEDGELTGEEFLAGEVNGLAESTYKSVKDLRRIITSVCHVIAPYTRLDPNLLNAGVIIDRTTNARVSPEGIISIGAHIANRLNDQGLAFTLSHEVSHYLFSDTIVRNEDRVAITGLAITGGAAVGAAAGVLKKKTWKRAAIGATTGAVVGAAGSAIIHCKSTHEQKHEFTADNFGLMNLLLLGMDPKQGFNNFLSYAETRPTKRSKAEIEADKNWFCKDTHPSNKRRANRAAKFYKNPVDETNETRHLLAQRGYWGSPSTPPSYNFK